MDNRSQNKSTLEKMAENHHLLFLPYFAAKGKFNIPKEPTFRAKDVFKNATTSENDIQLANLTHYDDFPVLEIYTSDTEKKAQSQMRLLAPYMNQFYLEYVQFLLTATQLLSGLWYKEPVKYTNSEIARRQLDLSSVEIELSHLLIEYNNYVDNYNKNTPHLLQQNHLTLEDFKALVCFCDVYKGIGCSTAVETEKLPSGEKVNRLMRNLDWRSLGALGKQSLAVLYPTAHNQTDKPRAVLSIGLTPGLFGLTLVNDRGLVIAVNEVCRMKTKRENTAAHAIPQLLLPRLLIENCSSVEEIKEYLKTHHPASSHIISAIDATGNGGVFEMLPNEGKFADQDYRFRGYDQPKNNKFPTFFHAHATNHFLDENGKPVMSSRVSDRSLKRYDDMEAALERHDTPIKVAQSANAYDTVQSMVFTHTDNQFKLDINIADAFGAKAINPDKNEVSFTSIDLTKTFSDFLQKVANRHGEENVTEIRQKRVGM